MSSPLVAEPNSLVINWKATCNGSDYCYDWSRFHYPWLKDNCLCAQCYDFKFKEKLIQSTMLPLMTSQKPKTMNYSRENDSFSVVWEDGHSSCFSADWLLKNTYEHNEVPAHTEKVFFSTVSCRDRTIEPVVFSKELGIEAPVVDYNALMESDDTFLEWSDDFERYGFCFVKNSPLDELAQRKLMNRVGQLRQVYGDDFYVFGEKDEFDWGSVDTTSSLEMHTDGTWFDAIPGVQLLHVFRFEGSTWAENILVDGVKLVEKIKEDNPYHFQILSSVPLTSSYTNEHTRYRACHAPIVLEQDTGSFVRLNFCFIRFEPFDEKVQSALKRINPEASMLDLYAAMKTFTKWMTHEDVQYKFILKPGTMLLTDNFRMMHGRMPYTGKRCLRGCYTYIEDWRAVLRAVRGRVSSK